ncbi:MAG: substrate-binding domain-containing protein [Bifidobacteriaceae bacterium]|jgi:ABC-type sugar transport system substrate-binding protein|nr:substrate-binding domain-containing protein [Bifidobacteriaceae bacterium]
MLHQPARQRPAGPAKFLRRRLLAIPAAALTAALSLAACSSGPEPGPSGAAASSPAPSASAKVAAVIKGLDNPFFQAMEDGIGETAKGAGLDVAVQAAADVADTTGQADKLAALAGQDYTCFIANPITGSNLIQALAPIAKSGKTIVNIDRPLDQDAAKAAGVEPATYIGTDNKAAGAKAGAFLAETLPKGSEVAVIGGVAGDVTSADRVEGLKDAIHGLTLIQEEAADWKREMALTKATDIMAAHPGVAAFFAANDDMGLGIVKAVENAGKTGKIAVISVDGNQDALKSVEQGGLAATVAQYPYAIGQLGVQACQVAAAGGQLPAQVESPTALVTKANAAAALAKFPQPFEAFANPLSDSLGR